MASPLSPTCFSRRWRELKRGSTQQIPHYWRPWLAARGSLTQHLINASQGQFQVQVIRQHWGQPTLDEARLLGLSARVRVLIREVHLLGRQQPWVYARSIIPATTLTGKQRQLGHIGNRSLGSVLFNDQSMHRGPLAISCLPPPGHATESQWARRSLFYLSGKPLLVCEVFLPALKQVNYSPGPF